MCQIKCQKIHCGYNNAIQISACRVRTAAIPCSFYKMQHSLKNHSGTQISTYQRDSLARKWRHGLQRRHSIPQSVVDLGFCRFGCWCQKTHRASSQTPSWLMGFVASSAIWNLFPRACNWLCFTIVRRFLHSALHASLLRPFAPTSWFDSNWQEDCKWKT